MNNPYRMALLLTLGMLPVAVFYQALSCLIQVKQKWRHRFLLATGSFLLIFMVIFTGDSVNFTCAILFFLFCMWVACKGTRLKRVTIGLMLASTILALNGLYDSCITSLPYFGLGLNDLWYLLFRLASTLFLYLCIRHNKPECDFELAPSLWRLILLLCIPPLGIVFSLVMFAPYDRSDDLILYTALFLVAIFAFVGIIRAAFVLNRHQKLEQENALAAYNQKYYETMEIQQFEIRRLKHDLANHLQMIQSLSAAEKDSYIQQMIENPVFEKVLVYSGDATVNAVLTAKERMMRQHGISFCAKVDIPHELPFEKPDLCALFANALDNAAEGVRGTGDWQTTGRADCARRKRTPRTRGQKSFHRKAGDKCCPVFRQPAQDDKIRYSEAWFWTAQHTDNRKKVWGNDGASAGRWVVLPVLLYT